MSALPRYRRAPLRTLGAAAVRKRPTRAANLAAVSRRAAGRCELCGDDVERRGERLDGHHAFGRGHLAGIPAEVCETPELILGICRGCHDVIHQGGLRAVAGQGLVDACDHARWAAVTRFIVHHELEEEAQHVPLGDPVDVMRELVRLLKHRMEAADDA